MPIVLNFMNLITIMTIIANQFNQCWISRDPLLTISFLQNVDLNYRASDRMRKKFKDYAEIFGHIMRKHALIMQKLHRIMRKFKQVIQLIIRPVQCIYMLTVNRDSKLQPIQLNL